MNYNKKNTGVRGEIIYKKKPKNNIVIPLLAILQETTLFTGDVVDLLLSRHTHIFPKVQRILNNNSEYRRQLLTAKLERLKNKQQIYSLLDQLHKQGFIYKTPINGKMRWNTTRKGFNEFLSGQIAYLPDHKQFQGQNSETFTVVTYDIPNKSNVLRNWLRDALINMEFKLLHKSVWMGKKKFPKKFIDKLNKFQLLPDQVKIFRVVDGGSVYY